MIDLSNNNAQPNWARVHQAGQRRVYLKCTEGTGFVDGKFKLWRTQAHKAGLKVGAYHFGHPGNSPIAEAHHFLEHVGHILPRADLRPCLDFEIGTPSAKWAEEWLLAVQEHAGVRPIIYSYPDFLRRAKFKKPPAPLWLASYGRNDGTEHPAQIPAPWKRMVAHQFSSDAKVAGIPGRVDISHVFNFQALEVPPPV